VRHALVLFGGIVPRKATTPLRERLLKRKLLRRPEPPAALFSTARQRQAGADRMAGEPRLASFLNEPARRKSPDRLNVSPIFSSRGRRRS
jgi:phage terminase large subunit-like protein